MKVIDPADSGKTGDKTGALDRLLDNVKSSLSRSEFEAREIFINALGKRLDNRYVLIKDVLLENLEVVIPIVLVGPTGVWVIYPSNARGIYRLIENTWEELDSRSQNYKHVKPNIIVRAELMARAVEDHLSLSGFNLPGVEPVMFFSDPGVHIDITRPSARIVLADALDRFVATVVQGQGGLDSINLHKVVEELGGDQERSVREVIQTEKQDAFSFHEESPPRRSRASSLDGRPDFLKRIPFTQRQLIVLGLLLVASISAVIFLIVYILVTI